MKYQFRGIYSRKHASTTGAPAKELQDPGRVKLMQYSNNANAPAPTPKGEDGRLTGERAKAF